MSRFLFVVPPLTGHINPTISVAAELTDRGHTCAWVGHRGALKRHLPDAAQIYALDDDVSDAAAERTSDRIRQSCGPERFKYLWEEFFVPLARSMVVPVGQAAAAFAPDIMVVDQQTLAGALIARQRQIPWATFCTTSADLVDPLAGLPKVRAWRDRLLADLQREVELPVVTPADISPHLVIGFTAAELLGTAELAPNCHLVGPSFGRRPQTSAFPWDKLGDGRLVLITLGTVNIDVGERFFREAVAAVAALQDSTTVMVAPAEPFADAPKNVILQPYVPQLLLLERADAVVCHGGHNTVVEALANGVPLVVAPIKDDQPVVAEQVVAAGAGLRVSFRRVKAAGLRAALERILVEPSFREAATRVGGALRRAGGAKRAATLLAELAV